jgi:hypothetical protein
MICEAPMPPPAQGPGPLARAMGSARIAAAVAAGRMPGEPAIILHPRLRPSPLARLVGMRQHRPLADPRLEILRAISAALTQGRAQIGGSARGGVPGGLDGR